jgi:UDP:flavonoid glycosyltransferase YjiC (YdhE family)
VPACRGSRGDVEPCVAVGRELLRRGHDLRMAVPPNLVGFAESAGLTALPQGPDTQAILNAHRKFWMCLFWLPLEDPGTDHVAARSREPLRFL